MDYLALKASIQHHEGYGELYRDTRRLWTCGWGHLVHDDLIPDDVETIGELLDRITDKTQHQLWLTDEITEAVDGARRWLGDIFENLSPTRQRVVAEMVYQMGYLGVSKFKMMRAAIVAGNHDLAADQGLDSQWAMIDSPQRARDMMALYRAG